MYRRRCAKKPNKPVQRIVGPANQGRLVQQDLIPPLLKQVQQPAVLEQDPLYERVVRLFEIGREVTPIQGKVLKGGGLGSGKNRNALQSQQRF